ncbi:MAG: DUF4440 domain-containing protein [Acidobacteria bacterium]|nr:DUF4440 domain-containing protein [Acidobacteriota bacterium]
MDDVHAIRLAKTELREGFNKGSVDRVLSVYADAYVDLSGTSASFYGSEAKAVLKYRLEKLFNRYLAQMTVTIYAIRIEGAIAFDRGCHKLTLTPKKGGRSQTIRTRYLEIWQKNPAGQWKISVFIDNQDRPPAMPPREVLEALAGRRPARSRRSAAKAVKS